MKDEVYKIRDQYAVLAQAGGSILNRKSYLQQNILIGHL